MTNELRLDNIDLDSTLGSRLDMWEGLRGGRLFVTGGTGFFGHWMLESLLRANETLGLEVEAVVLTRNPDHFEQVSSHIARSPAVSLLKGDVSSFAFPDGRFTHVLHMAAETNASRFNPRPSAFFDTAVIGTRRVLDFAACTGVSQFLLTSSGAIYGSQPPDRERLSEDDTTAPVPEDLDAAYAHGKRAAEFLCCSAHAETGLATKIARCFAFVGPHLPLESGFAVGNFIRDALSGQAIRVSGDGSQVRSYLYAADLALWLWTILLRGEPARPYNVGSEKSISILDLARLVADVIDSRIAVEVAAEPLVRGLRQRYVPDVSRAADELGLCETVALPAAIARTAAWHRGTTSTAEAL